MTILDHAQDAWISQRQTAQNHIHPSLIDRALHTLGEFARGGGGQIPVKVRPEQLVKDRHWVDSLAAVVSNTFDSTIELGVIFEDAEDTPPIMRAVGECARCEQRVVVDPPFRTSAELWESLNHGSPAHHDCPTSPVVFPVRPVELPNRLDR